MKKLSEKHFILVVIFLYASCLSGPIATYGQDVYSICDSLGMAPPLITPLTKQNKSLLTHPDGSLTERSHKILSHTPIGRFLQPDELFGALHYLASDASKGVTGSILTVDGGFNSFSI